MERMTAGKFRHMPIVADGKLTGLISIGDVVKHRVEEIESESEAMRDYAQAQELSTAGRNEEAIALYRAAVQRDPKFGRAYSGWATSAFYLGRKEEAADRWKKALALMDGMTEREKFVLTVCASRSAPRMTP